MARPRRVPTMIQAQTIQAPTAPHRQDQAATVRQRAPATTLGTRTDPIPEAAVPTRQSLALTRRPPPMAPVSPTLATDRAAHQVTALALPPAEVTLRHTVAQAQALPAVMALLPQRLADTELPQALNLHRTAQARAHHTEPLARHLVELAHHTVALAHHTAPQARRTEAQLHTNYWFIDFDRAKIH